jgi:hypothetical protein
MGSLKWGMGNGEWGMGNGEWGLKRFYNYVLQISRFCIADRGSKIRIPYTAFRIPHSRDYDSAALDLAARLTLFLASGFFATASSPLTVL